MIIKDIIYNESLPEYCKLDLYIPEGVNNPPVHIFAHGGGLEGGNKGGLKPMAEALLQRGIAFVSIDYRLYPVAKWPDYLVDSAKAIKWVFDNKEKYGLGNISFGGSSAGGYIAQMLYFDGEFLKNEGVNKDDIVGWMLDAGQPTSHYSYLKHDLKMDPRRVYIDKAAPLYYLTEEYTEPEKEPYITIACSDHDMVNRREQLIVMETAMLHFGFPKEKLKLVCFPDTRHTSYDFDKEFIDLIEELARK